MRYAHNSISQNGRKDEKMNAIDEGCTHFNRTGIKSSIEKECLVCPLRNENGDCIQDIIDDKGAEMGAGIAEIWRVFYESKNTKDA